jgi:uncharacterized membrane protein
MNKSRLEAFSDGVFAIVITLLILDIRIPDVPYSVLGRALVALAPSVMAYVLSFIIIGIYWVSHHISLQPIRKIDRVFLWLNILLLLFISFIPYPTALLGKYPFKALPIIIYGMDLMACNAVGIVMVLYVKAHPDLAVSGSWEKYGRRQIPIYLFVNGSYLLSIFLARVLPIVSYVIYGLVIFGLIVVLSIKNPAGYATPEG